MKKTLFALGLLSIAATGCDRKVNPYTDEGYAPSPDTDQPRRQQAPPAQRGRP